MLDCYVNALVLEPPVILGRKLLDLSLYHLAVLDTLGSPYVMGGAKSIDDLALGVWICSRNPKQIKRGMATGLIKKQMWLMGIVHSGADLHKEGQSFERYITEYMRMPEWWSSDGSPRRVPWYFSVAWAIMPRVGEDRAWSMSLALAMAYYATEADALGSRSVMTEAEMAAEKAISELRNGNSENTGKAGA